MKIYFLCVLSLAVTCYAVPKAKKPKPGNKDDDYEYLDDEGPKIPKTSFSCKGKIDGFYADIEAACRVFHYCQSVEYPDDTREKKKWPFMCPPTLIFRQEHLTCTKPNHKFKCKDSAKFFDVNEKLPPTFPKPKPKPPTTEEQTPSPTTSLPPIDDYDDESSLIKTTTSDYEYDKKREPTTPPMKSTTKSYKTTEPPSFLLPPLPLKKIDPLPPLDSFKPLWFAFQDGNVARFKLPVKDDNVKARITNKDLWWLIAI